MVRANNAFFAFVRAKISAARVSMNPILGCSSFGVNLVNAVWAATAFLFVGEFGSAPGISAITVSSASYVPYSPSDSLDDGGPSTT